MRLSTGRDTYIDACIVKKCAVESKAAVCLNAAAEDDDDVQVAANSSERDELHTWWVLASCCGSDEAAARRQCRGGEAPKRKLTLSACGLCAPAAAKGSTGGV